jgi:hypothetical protein
MIILRKFQQRKTCGYLTDAAKYYTINTVKAVTETCFKTD